MKALSCFVDFEFSGIIEEKVKLVSCATYCPQTKEKKRWWLHKDKKAQRRLKDYLHQFRTFICYSAIAEQRSFIALGLEPLNFQWIDLFLEYRMLTNHNDKLQWGKQLVDGKVKHVRKPRPKWERTEDDVATGFKATHSLAEATYKLTGKIRDTEHKNKMRELIISYPEVFSDKDKKDILGYNMSDVLFLPRMWTEIKKHFYELVQPTYRNIEKEEVMRQYLREAKDRGRYAAHTAWMETRGYPINVKATRNFSKQIPNIMYDIQREINSLFPDIKPFRWNKREGRFSWDQKNTKTWIEENHDESKWMKTDGGDFSLSLDAFTKFYDFKHDYPTDNFGAQMVRFLKLKQNLYGFSTGGKSRSFWNYMGPDGRVRPYMNIFGAQSSRSQPAATGFMFLKPAWMRALVQPAPGKFMAGIDYGSQEFFIAALRAQDQNMIEAYLSGDVYLAFAKLSKQAPKNATKESHKFIRDLCKSTVLGISYLMTKYGLAIKLTNDSGKVWSEDEAQEQIDLFYDAFPELKFAQEELQEEYGNGQDFIKLPCGWYMWGDNENIRSVVNVPIQGTGASIMRRAVDLNYERGGAPIAFTLHDALYIEGDVGDEGKIAILRDAMRDAFAEYFPGHRKDALKIKLDPFAWSPDYETDSEIDIDGWTIPVSDLYVDERSKTDYDKFSIYFEDPIEDLI